MLKLLCPLSAYLLAWKAHRKNILFNQSASFFRHNFSLDWVMSAGILCYVVQCWVQKSQTADQALTCITIQ